LVSENFYRTNRSMEKLAPDGKIRNKCKPFFAPGHKLKRIPRLSSFRNAAMNCLIRLLAFNVRRFG
jgi:hypothetical protein